MALLFPGQQLNEQAVLRAKQDDSARDDLIAASRSWILRVIRHLCRRQLSEQDDQFAVALQAFDEAITAYQPEQAASFSTFAKQVIHRRLIDWQRKEMRRQEVAWSDLNRADEDVAIEEQLLAPAAVQSFRQAEESDERREEIARLNREMVAFGITFLDLVQVAPKHRDAREAAMRVAQLLSRHPVLLEKLRRSGGLPLQELQEMVTVSRKTLERQRKYIIALTLVLAGEYPLIRAFIAWPLGGEEHGKA